jgi:SulP family sulfate permease
MAVVPKFLFGAVMIFIGIDLLKTWLVGVFYKLLFAEYLTVVGTFCCLNIFGVQLGLATGIALAAASFLVEYAKVQDIRVVHRTSNVIRNADQHALLYGANALGLDTEHGHSRQQDAIVTIALQGHIFFGSATRIQNCVKSAVYVRPPLGGDGSAANDGSVSGSNGKSERLPLLADNRGSGARYTEEAHVTLPPALVNLHAQPCSDRDRRPTRFVVLDFSQVSGMDATAARSCFLALKLSFSLGRVCAVYCGIKPSVEFLLRVNDVLPAQEHSSEERQHGDSHVTSDLDLALDWCEQQLILSAAKRRSIRSGQHLICSPLCSRALPLPQVFAAYLSDARKDDPAILQRLEELAGRFTVREWGAQGRLFLVGESSNSWYVLLRGTVELMTIPTEATLVSDSPKSEHYEPVRSLQDPSASATTADNQQRPSRELVGRVRPGCIFGDMDFMLEQPRVLDATATAPDTLAASFTRQEMDELRQSRPELAFLLHEVLLRASYMTLAEKLHSLAI